MRIPDFTSLGQTPAPQAPLSIARVETQPLEFNVRQGVGEAAIRGGREITSAGIEMQARQDTVTAEDATNKLQGIRAELESSPERGFSNVHGASAIGPDFYKSYALRFEDAQKQISSVMPTQGARQMFDQRAAILRHQYDSSLYSHISRETSAYADNTEKTTVQLELQNASNAPNDAAFDTSMVRIRGVLGARGSRLSEPASVTQANIAKAVDSAWTERIRVTMNDDPLAAQSMYDTHKDVIAPDNKVILERELHTSVRRVQATNLATSIINGASVDDAVNAIAAGGDAAITGVIQATTARRPNADLAQWVSDAQKAADAMHPNDPLFQNAVVTQVQGHVATLMAAQKGIAEAAHGAIMSAALGPDGKNRPLTIDQLLATPELKMAWQRTSPESQRGFYDLLRQNAREAEGVPMRVNSKVVDDLFNRVHLPATDPNKIISATQLAPYFARGLNIHYYDWLKKEIASQETDEGRSLTKTREDYLHGVKGQFDRSTIMNIDDGGGERFNNFRTFVLSEEAKAIASGGKINAYDLYNYKSPNYIGNKIPAFQSSLDAQIRNIADRLKPPTPEGAGVWKVEKVR